MLIAKIMTECDADNLGEAAQFDLYTGVTGVHITKSIDGKSAIASLKCAASDEPVEVYISAPLYLMNEQGKTISAFRL